jgi:hypothetical protein
MDVVDALESLPTDTSDRPTDTAEIRSLTVSD